MFSSRSIFVSFLTLALSTQAIPNREPTQCEAISTVFRTVTVTAREAQPTFNNGATTRNLSNTKTSSSVRATTTARPNNNENNVTRTTSSSRTVATTTRRGGNENNNNGGGNNNNGGNVTKAISSTKPAATTTRRGGNNNNGGVTKTSTSTTAAATTTKRGGNNNNGGNVTKVSSSTQAGATTTKRGGNNGATTTTSSSAAATTTTRGGNGGNVGGNVGGNNGGNNGGNTGGNNGGNNNGGGGNPQTSTTLNPRVIASGFANNGQDVPAAGQVPSLTSTNNFINFCLTVPNLPITNGKQITTGSCNPAPIGAIPSVDNMPSSKFTFPKNFGTIKAGETFTVEMAIKNMQTGFFVNAQANYFSAPQQLNGQGQIQGHSHVVIESLTSLSQTVPTDPKKFVFFKGLNAAAAGGKLTAVVPDGLAAGVYKLSSINTAANHQPVIAPIAQHGSLDDAIYFTVTADGKPANGGGNNVAAPVDDPVDSAPVAPAGSTSTSASVSTSVSTTSVIATTSASVPPVRGGAGGGVTVTAPTTTGRAGPSSSASGKTGVSSSSAPAATGKDNQGKKQDDKATTSTSSAAAESSTPAPARGGRLRRGLSNRMA